VRMARVLSVRDERVVVVDRAEPVAGAYAYGQLRWLSGANSGLASVVRASAGAELVLQEAPAFVPAAGDLVELREGCDRSLATCSGRFGNAVNFRGEPHLPGTDLLTRYPGG